MKCEHCNKNEATFYMKSNINGNVTELHLCQDCARELGYTDKFRQNLRRPSMFGSFFADDFFTHPFGMLEPFFGDAGLRLLSEFPDPMERKASTITTEQPSGLLSESEQQKLQYQRKRNSLENQLKDAVAREDFESAIKLRDELRSLQ